MPDYITKDQAWEVVKIVARHGGVDSIINADKRLAAMPPADVVEVVRCKDCRFRHKRESTAIGTYYVCILDGSQMPDPDYFCAHGENCRENQNAKTADVAPVVRCEDCRYCYRHADTGDYWCNKFAGLFTMVDLDDFCSRGERMDGGDQQCK